MFHVSGAFGLYGAKQRPHAVYCEEAEKTFFCWGGTTPEGQQKVADTIRQKRQNRSLPLRWGPNQLLHMISYYDHRTGTVPRPTVLLDKWCGDTHDGPVLLVDAEGYIWIFSPSHGDFTTPSYIHRSSRPYSIDRFETIVTTLYSYPQPWYAPGEGFFLMHKQYDNTGGTVHDARRCLCLATSKDGKAWSKPVRIATIERGHYHVTNFDGKRIVSALDYHPLESGLDGRTNLYVIQSSDLGKTWTTIDGKPLDMPLTNPHNPALVRDYKKEGLLVHLADMVFDEDGEPAILYVTSRGNSPGPQNDPRTWSFARWDGRRWVFSTITTSDHNFDRGSVYLERGGRLRVIAPTERGPQVYNPGGEVAMWVSEDKGSTWTMAKQLTRNSPRNHNFVCRPVNAHPDFYAFWADGHGRECSESLLYFTDQEGVSVRRLPAKMAGDEAVPEVVL